MKKLVFGIGITVSLMATIGMTSCKKTCATCPEGTTLSVDEPKEKNCICCPTGETFNEEKGWCE